MDKSDWNTILTLAAIAIAISAWLTWASVRSRRQLLVPLAASFVVSSAIYVAVMSTLDVNTGEKGADLFHVAVVIVLPVAAVVGAVLNRIRAADEFLPYIAWSLAGACLPPIVLVLGLFVTCPNGGCIS